MNEIKRLVQRFMKNANEANEIKSYSQKNNKTIIITNIIEDEISKTVFKNICIVCMYLRHE